jgi:GAF domain-containing protein
MDALMQRLLYVVRLQYPYSNPVENYRARLLIILANITIAVSALVMALTYAALAEARVAPDMNNSGTLIHVLGVMLVTTAPIVIVMVQQGNLWLGARVYVLSMLTLMVVLAVISGRPPAPLIALLPLLLASTLLASWEVLGVMLVIVVVNTYYTLATTTSTSATAALVGPLISSGGYLLISMLLVLTSRWLNNMALRLQSEVSRLRKITFPLLRTNLTVDETTFIHQAVESIAANLEFPTVRVYLTDGEKANTLRLVQSGISHDEQVREIVDMGSGFSSVLQTHEALFLDQNSTAAERTHFLPGTTSGALLPLMYREQVVGVLDVQSVGDHVIDASERELLSLVALHLATTIGNTRALNGVQSDVKQQQEIIMRQRNRLRQIEQTEQQAIVTAWTDYLDQRDQRIIGFDVNEVSMQLIPTDYLPEHMRQALERNDVATYEQDNQQHVTLPIQLRGQTLGAASFSVPSNRPITRRQVEIMRNVIQRLALALDNKRLFEQSQSQAQRESKANEIASLLLSSTDMDTVLRLAATNFNDALGAVQTNIQLFSEVVYSTQEEHA